mmetsp:Transcript_42807/g.89166  ORF Transcript_42807/g.89166 Transcript_42807/m.89166 type:complete len:280 (+) Transcript_42807:1210-2049(+)
MAFNSSARFVTEVSWSAALDMQSLFIFFKTLVASDKSCFVTWRLPMVVALVSVASCLKLFASPSSLSSTLTWSSKDCFRSSKLCLALVSSRRACSSWVTAFCFRSSSTSRMLPLRVLYASGAGAPKSASRESSLSPLPLCTRPMSFCLSWRDNAAASTTVLSTCTNLSMSAPFSFAWSKDELCSFRSRTLMARSRVSMVSAISASTAVNSLTSLSRICVAALRSPWFTVIAPARSSILEDWVAMSEFALSMVAVRSSISLCAVLISNSLSLAPFLHQSM